MIAGRRYSERLATCPRRIGTVLLHVHRLTGASTAGGSRSGTQQRGVCRTSATAATAGTSSLSWHVRQYRHADLTSKLFNTPVPHRVRGPGTRRWSSIRLVVEIVDEWDAEARRDIPERLCVLSGAVASLYDAGTRDQREGGAARFPSARPLLPRPRTSRSSRAQGLTAHSGPSSAPRMCFARPCIAALMNPLNNG